MVVQPSNLSRPFSRPPPLTSFALVFDENPFCISRLAAAPTTLPELGPHPAGAPGSPALRLLRQATAPFGSVFLSHIPFLYFPSLLTLFLVVLSPFNLEPLFIDESISK